MSMQRIFFKRMLRKYRHQQGIYGAKPMFKFLATPSNEISRSVNRAVFGQDYENSGRRSNYSKNNQNIRTEQNNNKNNKNIQDEELRKREIDEQTKLELENYYREKAIKDTESAFPLKKLFIMLGILVLVFVSAVVVMAHLDKSAEFVLFSLLFFEAAIVIKRICAKDEEKKLWNWIAILFPITLIFLATAFVVLLENLYTVRR